MIIDDWRKAEARAHEHDITSGSYLCKILSLAGKADKFLLNSPTKWRQASWGSYRAMDLPLDETLDLEPQEPLIQSSSHHHGTLCQFPRLFTSNQVDRRLILPHLDCVETSTVGFQRLFPPLFSNTFHLHPASFKLPFSILLSIPLYCLSPV